jgi:hypothetical protein
MPDCERLDVNGDLLAKFDIDDIPIITLMLQTGYLTILEEYQLGDSVGYTLSYPNLEVKYSINNHIARVAASSAEAHSHNSVQLFKAMRDNDWNKFQLALTSLFAAIPHQWYINNNITNYEGFYCSVVYSYLAGLAYEVTNEDSTNQGRIDITVKMPDKILILEFKLSSYGSAQSALQQIKDKNYAAKYLSIGKPIYLFGISFDADKKNIAELIWEKFEL